MKMKKFKEFITEMTNDLLNNIYLRNQNIYKATY